MMFSADWEHGSRKQECQSGKSWDPGEDWLLLLQMEHKSVKSHPRLFGKCTSMSTVQPQQNPQFSTSVNKTKARQITLTNKPQTCFITFQHGVWLCVPEACDSPECLSLQKCQLSCQTLTMCQSESGLLPFSPPLLSFYPWWLARGRTAAAPTPTSLKSHHRRPSTWRYTVTHRQLGDWQAWCRISD